MSTRSLTAAAALGLVLAASAGAQEPPPTPTATEPAPQPEPVSENPCDLEELALRCPDLTMAPPTKLVVKRGGGKVHLQAENRIVNVGSGPLEVRGKLEGLRRADADQVIHTRDGSIRRIADAGELSYKFIPRQGFYWKYHDAARFEIWSLAPDGTRDRMVRTGPKVDYCFRDLARVRPKLSRTPRRRVYGACVLNRRPDFMKLGTSVGWADIYPETYYENYVSITRLRGCFAFVHRVDPNNNLTEESEANNLASRRVSLPPTRRGRVSPRGSCRG